MHSSRIVQPGFNSPSRTRPSSTCSLKATTRSASSPPFVTGPRATRIRFPLAPATLRAGGWISAGMISTVQIPLPIRAAIEPNDCPQRCAPSPESLMISTMASSSVSGSRELRASAGRSRVPVSGSARIVVMLCPAPAIACQPLRMPVPAPSGGAACGGRRTSAKSCSAMSIPNSVGWPGVRRFW